MFKKPVKVGAQNQLSGKDKKTVKNKISALFNPQAAQKIFAIHEKIICNKITGSKMLIYTSEDYPLIVDGTGKQDFFPSIYTCSAFQTLLKNVVINQGVQNYIFNGANLMWPGVNNLNSLGKFKKDDVVAIQNSKRQVIAVGALGCSFDELKSNTDGSGIAVYILHYKGDKLWDMGDKTYPDVVIKAVQEKIQQPKVQIKEQIKEIKKQQVQIKQQKKQVNKQQESETQKGKGKKKKQVKIQQPQTQIIQVKSKNNKKEQQKPKQVPKKQQQPQQQSDQEADFGNLVHSKKPQKVQFKMQKKKNVFSDEEDDKKGKKKGGKKGGHKKKEQQEQQFKPIKKEIKKQQSSQQQIRQQVTKPNKNKKKKQVQEQEQNPKQNKNKKKKEASQNESQQQNAKQKKNKKKKEVQQNESQQQNNNIKNKKKKEVEQNENQEGAKSAITSQLMDQYFRQAFLNVLKLTKVQNQLPIDSGRFFSDYMILARSDEVKLQIKDSSFKKLGKFYEQMAKQKFIEFKPAKEKKGQQGSTITKIFWQNQQLKNYFPTIKKMGEKDVEQKTEQYSKQKLKLTKTLQIDYVYKLNDELKKILFKKVINYMPEHSDQEQPKEDPKKQIFLNQKELKQKIEKYINQIALKDAKQQKEAKQTKENKQGKDKQKKVDKLVTINYKQNQFIMNLLKHEIEQYEQNAEKEEMMAHHDSDEQQKKKDKKGKGKRSLFKIQRGYIVNKIMKLTHPYYNMIDKQHGLNKFKQGIFKGIQLIADKIMNKNVTKVIGLESFSPLNVESEELVKQIHGFAHLLQLKFASSANVQNLPGKNAGKQILIQGNFVDELESMLMIEYGIKKEHITIQNKLGKKKKN